MAGQTLRQRNQATPAGFWPYGVRAGVTTCLVRIEDAQELVAGHDGAGRVKLRADIVDVAALAVHLARRPLAAAHIHHVRAQRVHPLALLGVLRRVDKGLQRHALKPL